MKKASFLKAATAILLAAFLFCGCDQKEKLNDSSTSGTVTDHEGNVYKTIKIGKQTWMAENMRCTTSPTGKQWQEKPTSETFTPYYAHKAGTENGLSYSEYYYNWSAAIDYCPDSNGVFSHQPSYPCRGICPEGWHIPSVDDWNELKTYVDVHFTEGGGVGKSLASQQGWRADANERTIGNQPSSNNASGFTALPVGYYLCNYAVGFFDQGIITNIWSARQSDEGGATYIYLTYNHPDLRMTNDSKTFGNSVRCVKD